MDFLIHPCRWIDDEQNVHTPPKLRRSWEIHPLRPRDFPRPSRFPSGFALGKSLGSREISWASGMDFPIPPSFWWSTDTFYKGWKSFANVWWNMKYEDLCGIQWVQIFGHSSEGVMGLTAGTFCSILIIEWFSNFSNTVGTNLFLWQLRRSATCLSATRSFARTKQKRRCLYFNNGWEKTFEWPNTGNTKWFKYIAEMKLDIKLFPFQVWAFVQGSLILSSLATGIFVAASGSNFTFLRCVGREEVFRWSDDLKGL